MHNDVNEVIEWIKRINSSDVDKAIMQKIDVTAL